MLELASELLPLLRAGEAVAVVTVARVARSSPRGAGASMALTADGRAIGSISGGCVESDALAFAAAALASGAPVSARLGFSDETAHAAGLACGGSVDVVAYRVSPTDGVAVDALEAVLAGRAAALGIVTGGDRAGLIIDADALSSPAAPGWSGMLVGEYDGTDVLVVSRRPRARLIIVGAGEHAAALCRVAAAAGFAVTVCDVWELLATPARFPDAAALVVGLPDEHLRTLTGIDERTAVCVLSHDERVDVPALEAALALPVGFVGAMGARSTVAHRARLLRERGVADADIARIHAPLGLDLGGTSPEEAAIAALAEIQAVRHGTGAHPLRSTTGPLHARVAPQEVCA